MKKTTKLIIITLLTIIFLYTYKFIYNKYNIGIPCIFHKLTGLYCPGCGITRAIFYLIELKPLEALKQNALLIIIFPFITIQEIENIKKWIKEQTPKQIFPKSIWYALLIITITFGIIRNIDYFSWLQPK